MPATEATLTIEACGGDIRASACLQHRNVPRALTAKPRSHSSAVVSAAVLVATTAPGVVDQDVELRAERLVERLVPGEHPRLVGDIRRHVPRDAARRLDPGDDLAAGLLAAGGDQHRRARGRQALRRAASDARASAGHERDLALELSFRLTEQYSTISGRSAARRARRSARAAGPARAARRAWRQACAPRRASATRPPWLVDVDWAALSTANSASSRPERARAAGSAPASTRPAPSTTTGATSSPRKRTVHVRPSGTTPWGSSGVVDGQHARRLVPADPGAGGRDLLRRGARAVVLDQRERAVGARGDEDLEPLGVAGGVEVVLGRQREDAAAAQQGRDRAAVAVQLDLAVAVVDGPGEDVDPQAGGQPRAHRPAQRHGVARRGDRRDQQLGAERELVRDLVGRAARRAPGGTSAATSGTFSLAARWFIVCR